MAETGVRWGGLPNFFFGGKKIMPQKKIGKKKWGKKYFFGKKYIFWEKKICIFVTGPLGR